LRRVWLILAAAVVLAVLPTLPRGERVLRVSTTTSLYATGLLDALAEEFQAGHPGVVVQFIPVGSGEALRRAEMGDADLVLVHAPSWCLEYLVRGFLKEGEVFSYNYFVLVVPPSDPAGASGLDPVEAFSRLYEAGERGEAAFVSRGDNSGTHVREMSLWSRAGLDPRGRPWYVESGSGMSETLLLASEKGAYTLSDIGTYLKMRDRIELEVLVEGGGELLNIYSVYLVNPERVPGVDEELAGEFAHFLLTDGQSVIASYGVEEFGRPLFHPREDWLKGEWERLARG